MLIRCIAPFNKCSIKNQLTSYLYFNVESIALTLKKNFPKALYQCSKLLSQYVRTPSIVSLLFSVPFDSILLHFLKFPVPPTLRRKCRSKVYMQAFIMLLACYITNSYDINMPASFPNYLKPLTKEFETRIEA